MSRRDRTAPQNGPPCPGQDSADPFFVVGAGRSGTTLLRLMLAGHSRLHIPAETWFLLPLVERLPLHEALSPAQVETALSIITGHPRWTDLGFPAGEFRRQARAIAAPRIAGILELIFRQQRALSGKPRIGEKTPHYFAIVPQLATIFPAARFIHLVRDGRDVAMSWIEAGWQRYHQPDFEWTRAAVAAGSWRKTPLRRRVLEVRYETLVSAPEATLRTICDFLGEAFEPAMLDGRHRRALVAERDRHLHAGLERPVSAESVERWRGLPAWQCFAMEACLGRDLAALGYQPRFAGAAWRPALAAAEVLLRGASPLLTAMIPRLQRRRLLPPRLYL